MSDRFQSLFVGGNLGHGEWDQQSGAKTISGPALPVAYERHLKGEVGLGLVPVNEAGTCHFAAIDIDDRQIDHLALLQKVRARKFPLHVCRSKRGGAHLYLFPKHPLSAVQLRQLLTRWAALLGYPNVEIFPKQNRIGGDNVGNWINLPYYGGDNTTRYQVSEDGALTLAQFLDGITYYDPELTKVDEQPSADTGGLPPCLAKLSQHKLPEGSRNVVLFNTAVFYRKSDPDNWKQLVEIRNQAAFEPPLPSNEVQSIVRSTSHTRYQYTCEQSPLREYCNRALCEQLPFGVANKPWQEQDVYHQANFMNLKKILTDPPTYVLSLNGKELKLSLDELFDFRKLRRKALMDLSLIVAPRKQGQWEQQLRILVDAQELVNPLEDESPQGLIIERFEEFLQTRERAQNREDLLRGYPIQEENRIYFRFRDFIQHLRPYKLDSKLPERELSKLLIDRGCDSTKLRINGKVTHVRFCSLEVANDQSEDFVPADFTKEGKDEEKF